MKYFRSYALLLLALAALLWLSPPHLVDPWGILNPHRIIQLIFALTVLQILGSVLMTFFKGRVGGVAFGFFGGLISSTALTAFLAKQSQDADEDVIRLLSLAFLSGLLGTILEGAAMVLLGLTEIHWEIFLVFSGSIIATPILMMIRLRSLRHIGFEDGEFLTVHPRSIVKLGLLIAVFLGLSKLLLNLGEPLGQFLLTFVICLFELQGSIIGNVQLHELKILNIVNLGHLIAVGILASYLAKWGLVIFLGSPGLKRRASKYMAILISAHLLGWGLFTMASRY